MPKNKYYNKTRNYGALEGDDDVLSEPSKVNPGDKEKRGRGEGVG